MTTIPQCHNYIQLSTVVDDILPSKATKRRRTSSVKFSATSLQHEIPHINDHTEEERRDIWWKADDIYCFQLSSAIIVRQMEAMGNEFEECDTKCTRGLEAFTTEGDRRRKKRRRDAAQAVLQEQTRQWAHAIHQPELIAQSYQGISVPSQRDAHAKAIREKKNTESTICYNLTSSS